MTAEKLQMPPDWTVADLSALSHITHPSHGCRPNPRHLQGARTPDPDSSWSRVGTAQSSFWRGGDRSLPVGCGMNRHPWPVSVEGGM